mmetsp:Transcript_55711/g.154217  ORF Transcript_55711/g.154217 Transcript_55711/m.154217 type:complete len:235 (-) Transcript_55711:574-1278(-)
MLSERRRLTKIPREPPAPAEGAGGKDAQGHRRLDLPFLHLRVHLPVVQVRVFAYEFTMGGLAVAPSPANLLAVVLDGRRHSVVEDPADVWFVDAHAKGDGGDHDLDPAALELLLRLFPFVLLLVTVVDANADAVRLQQVLEVLPHLLDIPNLADVNDRRGTFLCDDGAGNALAIFLQPFLAGAGNPQVGPVHAVLRNHRVAQVQVPKNVVVNHGRAHCREGHNGHPWELLPEEP